MLLRLLNMLSAEEQDANVARQRGSSTKTTSAQWLLYACLALFAVASHIGCTEAAAVMSVDLGTEWMKVGVVSPGVPMEIALNRESKRKTPAILAFRDGIRTFGEDAMTVGIREPAAAYGYLLDLLGKTVDNPIVELFKSRFPYYDIVADPKRNTVIFKKSESEQFSVEELIAQMLVKAKEFAQESTSQPITECVLTVPGYFGQAEREAILAAAQLANLKVLQLINDYTAVALNYGVFHRADINETAQYFLFYDMGASKTSAAVVSYQLVKDKQTRETNPVVHVLGVGYDRALGGLEVQLRLRDYLAAEFNAMRKTTTDVTKSPRALAKLFKEAGRVKNVLSANNDHFAQIENLLEDHDFKIQVTREKLEELCADMWPRVVKPLEQAIAASGLSLELMSQVIIFGGGTRVPKVQETIRAAIKQELGKSLNADEAATMGAVYKAADLATGFKVKKFVIKDAVLFPIEVSFERDAGNSVGPKQVKRVLFGSMNTYPQKKVITFNKHIDDFDFHVHYGSLAHLSAEEVAFVGQLSIARVQLQNIREVIEKNTQEMVESKGIKAYFALDDSGLFRCTGIDFVYDKQKTDDEDESTLAKLGNTISKLFSKDGPGKDDEGHTIKRDFLAEGGDEREEADAEKSGETQGSKADDVKQEGESKNDTKTDEPTDVEKDKAPPKNETIKIVVVKEPITHQLTVEFTLPLEGKAYEDSHAKLTAINRVEDERNRLESSFNALESHVIETMQKLDQADYASCTTAEEKEKILTECAVISEWLYEDIENPTPDVYENRLKELKKLTNVFLARHWEHEERPEALKSLDSIIKSAQKFLGNVKNLTKETSPDNDVFTQVELDMLSKAIDASVAWRKAATAEQAKLKRNEEVRLTVKEITDKISYLDREVKYLVNKMKIWKPKVKPTPKQDKKTDQAANNKEAETDDSDKSGDQSVDDAKASGESGTKEEQVETPQNAGAGEDVKPEPTPTEEEEPSHSEL